MIFGARKLVKKRIGKYTREEIDEICKQHNYKVDETCGGACPFLKTNEDGHSYCLVSDSELYNNLDVEVEDVPTARDLFYDLGFVKHITTDFPITGKKISYLTRNSDMNIDFYFKTKTVEFETRFERKNEPFVMTSKIAEAIVTQLEELGWWEDE